jgi:hypothetical protein
MRFRMTAASRKQERAGKFTGRVLRRLPQTANAEARKKSPGQIGRDAGRSTCVGFAMRGLLPQTRAALRAIAGR